MLLRTASGELSTVRTFPAPMGGGWGRSPSRLWRRRSTVAALAAMSVTLTCANLSRGQIAVMQVEASISGTTQAYAPINFNGASSLSGAAAGYPAITTIYAQTNTYSNTYSVHAQFVANNFYGTNSVGSTAISTVYTSEAKSYYSDGSVAGRPFYDSIFATTNGNITSIYTANAPVPKTTLTDLGIRITNHSYVDDFSDLNATVQKTIPRAADFLINRDNNVWVAGAVNGSVVAAGDGTTYLAWTPRNAIAVRGDSNQTAFNPLLGPVGRKHADFFVQDLASFACGTISGDAAAMIKQGITIGSAAAQDQRVIKSALMSGADSRVTSTQGAFVSAYVNGGLTQNNLDPNAGTGLANYANSLAIVSSQAGSATASGATTGASIAAGAIPSTSSKAFNLGTSTAAGNSVVMVNITGPATYLNANLNWDVTSNVVSNVLKLDDANVVFPDLALELRPVTWNGTAYALGAALASAAQQGFTSNATGTTNDNVEHLYLQQGQLAPGTYAFIIKGDATKSVAAALTYNFTTGAVPAYNVDASGTYAQTSNFTGSASPTGVSTAVLFPNVISAARTVTIDAPIILGSVAFSGSNTYTLSGTNGANLTLTNGALGPAQVQVTSGNPVLSLPVVTLNNTTFNNTVGTSLTVQSVANNATISTAGAGTLRIGGSISGTGAVVVGTGSTLAFSNAPSSSLNLKLLDQATLSVAATGTVVVTSTASVAGNKPRVSVVTSIVDAGFVNLGNSDLIVHSTTEAVLRGYVSSWYAGGTRAGTTGIGSSLSGTGTGMDQYTSLAVITNSDGIGGALYGTFDGQLVVKTDVLVKYTYLGDTNLNGVVDGADLENLLAGTNGGLTGWVNGDLNYDGSVNAADLTLFMSALTHQAGSFGDSVGGGGAVPEPSSFALAAPAVALLSRRRRA